MRRLLAHFGGQLLLDGMPEAYKALPFRLPDFNSTELDFFRRFASRPVPKGLDDAYMSQPNAPRNIATLFEKLLSIPAGSFVSELPNLSTRLRAVDALLGRPAFAFAAQILYALVWEQGTEQARLELSATCFVAHLHLIARRDKIRIPDEALSMFSHHAVIWWTLLQTMHRQERTGILTPAEVTVDHLDTAMQLLSLHVIPHLPSEAPQKWQPYFMHITEPMWFTPKMAKYKSICVKDPLSKRTIWKLALI
ncbi:hypothetical protein JCM10908_000084 [Rhodotorula pacifica]|uniref:uncharacterized protein n=1 Tax=Rhodotorula pacifica TaxID=1495444 RepID=UPI00316F0A56